jgi:hypothetical protein
LTPKDPPHRVSPATTLSPNESLQNIRFKINLLDINDEFENQIMDHCWCCNDAPNLKDFPKSYVSNGWKREFFLVGGRYWVGEQLTPGQECWGVFALVHPCSHHRLPLSL